MNAHGPASDGDLTWIPISRFAPIMHPQRVRFAAQNDSAMRPSTIYEFCAAQWLLKWLTNKIPASILRQGFHF